MSARALASVWLVVTAWCAVGIAAPAARGGHVTADEPQYLLSAISIGEDGDLDISDERAGDRYRTFHRAELPVQELVRDDGTAVSPHDPLLPVLLALPMLVGGWIAAKLALAAFAGALAAALVWVAVVRLGVAERDAITGVLAFAAAAPLAFYGTQVYPEVPAALAVTLAVAALTGPLGARGVALLGACVVALPWLAVKYAPVAVVLAGIAAVRLWRAGARRPLLALGVWGAASAVLFAGAHLAWYGGLTPYAAGDHFTGGELTVMGHDPDYAGRAIRLVGLLLDRDFGLGAWQPAYLLAVPALVVLLRDRPRWWCVVALPLLVGWCNAAFVALTMHGWWWPGRQVVVVLPCVVLAVTWFASTRPAIRPAQAVFGDLTIVVGFEDVTHPLVGAWRALLPDYRERSTTDWVLHGAWIGAIAVVAALAALPRLRTRPLVRRWQGRTARIGTGVTST
jgi:hypothetical protein